MLRGEMKALQEKAEMPARELKVLKDEIRAMMESAAARLTAAQAQATPAPRQFGRAMSPATAWITNADLQALQDGLVELEMDPALAAEAAGTAFAALRSLPPIELAGGAAGGRETEYLTRALAERIRVSGGIRLKPGRPVTVALVGPTGVGKTTTLAKLGALAKIQQGKKVGIISADSFRMGANEQLEIFGRTAGIPVKSVFSAADVAQAQRDFADRDLILVDTAGRSHGHKEMWRELQGLLHCLSPDEIHLVLAGPTRMRELWHQYGLYRDLGASSLIFTKLDECLSLGCVYNLARRAEAPIAYLCNGQVIPDHILLARADLLAGALAEAARAALPSAAAPA
jgi:flagellar biosynthesis protein FlhF